MTKGLCWIAGSLLMGLAVQAQDIRLIDAFPDRRFDSPVFLTFSPDSTNRLFVVQQDGLIKVFANDPAGTRVDTFLDLRAKITPPSGEEGLLGMAFHPYFASNGFFYVNYTAPKAGAQRISVRVGPEGTTWPITVTWNSSHGSPRRGPM